MMRTATRLIRFCLLPIAVAAIAALVCARAADAEDIAVVVRPDVPVNNLPFSELRRMMLGERQFWSSNVKVTLLVRAPGARERDVVLKTIYQMSEAQFRQYWIAKVFRAEAASGPRIVYSNEMATELSASILGAVAFMNVAQVPKSLKVLKINGLSPGQPGYPIR
jgi:hypothetical protein